MILRHTHFFSMQRELEDQVQEEIPREKHTSDSSSTDDSDSDSGSGSELESDSDSNSITPEYLASLLEKAKASIREKKGKQRQEEQEVDEAKVEDILLLDKEGDDDM